MKQAQKIFNLLLKSYPDAHCELTYKNSYELLISTILSAQCTDIRVNMVTPALFKKFPTAIKMSTATLSDIEDIIRSTGFYKNKAKNILSCCQDLVHLHQGNVPSNMDDLINLAGVGRKTANVVLGNAFNINEGIVVDTHVRRLSNRLHLSLESDPVKIEGDLIKLFKRNDWCLLSHLLIFHGRRICKARNPNCTDCPLKLDCPSAVI